MIYEYNDFDEVFFINSNSIKYLDSKKINYNQKNLFIILDNRNLSLNQKNIIKTITDKLSVDCLIYTIRPSLKKFSKNKKFNLLLKWNFIFQILSKYKIKKINLNSSDIKVFKKSNFYLKKIFNFIYKNKQIFLLKYNKNTEIKKSLIFLNYLKKKDFIYFQNIEINILKRIDKKNQFKIEKQIKKKDQKNFWFGFDKSFQDVPFSKKYKSTKWKRLFKKNKFIYEDKIKYCTRCCLPETMEGITFDDFGVCTPCRSSEEKMHIDWKDKEKKLLRIFKKFRKANSYDCILPISGGKDSTFQAYVLKNKYKLNPLTVTHGTNWLSSDGRYNLENLLYKFDVDNFFYLPNRKVVNNSAKKSVSLIGDACWLCHTGASVFPFQIAINWKVPLMIYGESIAEKDGRGSYKKTISFKDKLYYGLQISSKVKPEKFVDKNFSQKDYSNHQYPSYQSMIRDKITNLHLGDFIFWDEQKQTEFIINEFDWKISDRVENTYKGYKSNECIMAGVHDYLNFIKRGVGRATLHASEDVRRGLIRREEAIKLIKDNDPQRPHALDYFLRVTKLKEKNVEQEIISSRKSSKFASKLNKFK
tara:strand:+ start:428 stop:2188 length:1761 start_codon:yes stop_codon:yes gene_type:complete